MSSSLTVKQFNIPLSLLIITSLCFLNLSWCLWLCWILFIIFSLSFFLILLVFCILWIWVNSWNWTTIAPVIDDCVDNECLFTFSFIDLIFIVDSFGRNLFFLSNSIPFCGCSFLHSLLGTFASINCICLNYFFIIVDLNLKDNNLRSKIAKVIESIDNNGCILILFRLTNNS